MGIQRLVLHLEAQIIYFEVHLIFLKTLLGESLILSSVGRVYILCCHGNWLMGKFSENIEKVRMSKQRGQSCLGGNSPDLGASLSNIQNNE